MISKIQAALIGLAVGDALGVPVEFVDREELDEDPVADMIGYGTHNQAPGTWSDDSALSFCLAEGLIPTYNLDQIAQNFVQWKNKAYWTATGTVFDIGISTLNAIFRLSQGVSPLNSGEKLVSQNGNGSLMRILPLLFYLRDFDEKTRFQTIKEVSSITHAHEISVLSCTYYLEFAKLLLEGIEKYTAYEIMQQRMADILKIEQASLDTQAYFDNLIKKTISTFPRNQVFSSGFVIHSLEASMYCLLSSHSYEESILKAVNLGDDTDTTASITGGLAGLLYGLDNIPLRWRKQLAKEKEIMELGERLAKTI
jgi:ADP-ribosylglycohydrolase